MIYVTMAVFFIFAVLSGLGVGGGGLLMIYLALFTEVGQLAAQGINLLFFLFSSGTSILVHLSKRKIFFSAVAVMSLTGVIGALVGSFLSGMIDQNLLRKIFGAMLIVCGILSLRSSKGKKREKFTIDYKKNSQKN